MTVTYFAYGSNMAPAVMARLCPQHHYLGVARLANHRLAFTRRSRKTGTGVADVVESPGDAVWGTVYEIADRDMRSIDRKEGYGWAYTKVMLPVKLSADSSERTAVIYTVASKEPAEIPPSREYLDRMITAAHARGLPDGYVTRMAMVCTAEDVTGQ